MSASSRSSSHPADQVASSLEQGRKLIFQLTCGGYLLYLLAHRLFLPGAPLSALGPELLIGYICAVAVMLSLLPTIHFRLLTSVLTLIFLLIYMADRARGGYRIERIDHPRHVST